MSNQHTQINMIKQQMRTGGVLNEQILNLYHEVSREDFVPEAFRPFAYSDLQIPLLHGQRMMTPLEEAKLLQALSLTGNEIVLEVGTGSGFLTALLSNLCKTVISVDYHAEFTLQAGKRLAQYQCDNATLITGDAHQGWVDKAPYDRIIFTAGMETLTDMQRLQLVPGGKLFALIGKEPVMQGQLHVLDHKEQWDQTLLFETSLPSLIDTTRVKDFVF